MEQAYAVVEGLSSYVRVRYHFWHAQFKQTEKRVRAQIILP